MGRQDTLSKSGLSSKLFEKRQLAKIEPLERPSLAGVDPKIARSLIRVYRKELKQRQQAQYIDAAKEVGLGSVAAVIYSGGQIASKAIEGLLDIPEAIAGNNQPLAQAVAIGGGIAAFAWFVEAFPGAAKFLRIDNLAFRLGFGPPKQTVNGSFYLLIKEKLTGKLVWAVYADASTRQLAIDYYSRAPQTLFWEVITTQEAPPPRNLGAGISKTSSTIPTGAVGPFATIGDAAIALAVGSNYSNQGYFLVRVNGIIYIVPPGTVLT